MHDHPGGYVSATAGLAPLQPSGEAMRAHRAWRQMRLAAVLAERQQQFVAAASIPERRTIRSDPRTSVFVPMRSPAGFPQAVVMMTESPHTVAHCRTSAPAICVDRRCRAIAGPSPDVVPAADMCFRQQPTGGVHRQAPPGSIVPSCTKSIASPGTAEPKALKHEQYQRRERVVGVNPRTADDPHRHCHRLRDRPDGSARDSTVAA